MTTSRRHIFPIILILLIILSASIALVFTNSATKTYTDERFKFSVTYPTNWSTKIDKGWDATTEHEGSPDTGIEIFIDGNKNDRIYVFGQNGHFNLPHDNYEKRIYVTNSGTKGTLYTQDVDGRRIMYLILDEGFHNAFVNVDNDSYAKNEKQITDVLKSITLNP